MLGTGIFAPSAFTNRDGMVQIKTNPLTILNGATHAWAADNLPAGKTSRLLNVVGGSHFATNWPTNQTLWPTAVDVAGRSRLSFDGGALDVTVSLPSAKTVILIGALPTLPTEREQFLLHGGAGPAFALSAAAGKFKVFGGANLVHTKDADTNRHVFILSHSGANSVLSIDGVEVAGNAGSNAPTALRIGGTTSSFNQSVIEQIQVLPYAAGPAERAAILAKLRSAYGI